MNTIDYTLRPRSGTWSPRLESRLVAFDITVERHGRPLGGHNIQAFLFAPDYQPRDYRARGLDDDVALTLESGWWITLRNQFAEAPDIAAQILASAAKDLSAATAEASVAREDEIAPLWQRLRAARFSAAGPDYWS
jgi:hypothetical protein